MALGPRAIRWRGEDAPSIEHLVVEPVGDGMILDAVVLAGASQADWQALRYRLYADDAGRTRRLEVQRIGQVQSLRLKSDGQGQWLSEDDTPLPALAGAIDVDLPVTPATNALPIRRLRLAVGQSASLQAVYVNADLSLSRDPQRYTRLAEDRYLYESLDSDFRCEITVDADGFVVDYPGLFRRL